MLDILYDICYYHSMKKLFLLIVLFCIKFSLIANPLSSDSKKITYDRYEVINVMNKYHKKYGKGEVNCVEVYTTVSYWARFYDIDLAFALSFFGVESGFTYVCTSSENAVGMGQPTRVALKDFNDWYNKNIRFEDLNNKSRYDINIMVSLGYIRMCWDRYSVIQNGDDLIKAYNVGVGNLKKIKNGTYSEDNFWTVSANRYSDKFNAVYSDFIACRR